MTHKPHDAFFRIVFGRCEHAASEFRAALPPALLAELDLSSLKDESEALLGPDLTERTCDLIFQVKLKGDDAFLYVLNEHQTKSTHQALARFFFYAARALERWTAREENKGWTRLPPLICLLVYPGPGPWSAPTQFRDLFGVSDALGPVVTPYLPSFQILVDNLDERSNEELEAREGGALARLCWLLLKNARASADLRKKFQDWASLLQEVTETARDLEAVARYTLVAGPLSPEEVREIFRDVAGPSAEEAVVTAGEQLIQKGRAEGRAEGETSGQRKLLLAQLRTRFPGEVSAEVESRVTNARETQIQAWGVRFATAKTLDEVFAE